jgi:hypothetical protein
MQVSMMLVRKFRGSRAEFRRVFAFVALSAVLVLGLSRLTATVYFSFTSQARISSANAGPRWYFDHDTSEWCKPASIFSFPAPEVVLLRARFSSETQLAFATDGFHYNRPPPFL